LPVFNAPSLSRVNRLKGQEPIKRVQDRRSASRSGMLRGICAQRFQTFLGVLAPLRTGHVVARIEHVLTASLAQTSRIILEELNLSAAVRTRYFINVVQLPVPKVLSRAMQLSHVCPRLHQNMQNAGEK